MPPKRSDIQHVTFHFYKSAVLLSVSHSTSIKELKSQLLSALRPLASTIPTPPPKSVGDVRLWEDAEPIEGSQEAPGLRCLDDRGSELMSKSILALGWPRWKRVYVAFKDGSGSFGEPVYTIPDADDPDPGADDVLEP